MDPTNSPTDSPSGKPAGASPADEASIAIAASPDRIYGIVTDIAAMGRLSPECTGGKWLDGATGPAVGARFRGTNKRGWVRWSSVNRVVGADPGREFAFETRESGVRWRYALEPSGDGTLVTESRQEFKKRPAAARFFARFLLVGVEEHDDEMRAGLVATLERLKAVAES